MTRFFGTDGVRGIANQELTCEMAYVLGRAAVELLGGRLVIGRDTRKSGPMLEAALVAGITSAGGDALLAGIIPTPAVALFTRELNASGGVVISASHNPPEYNGIKFFNAEGFKLTREQEDAFEERLQALMGHLPRPPLPQQLTPAPFPNPTGAAVGTVIPLEDANERYVAHAVEVVRGQGFDLAGLHVAVDCGHGASFATTPEALRQLGATVTAINTDFNGNNINVGCGSTHLEQLKALVAKTDADLGIAHDGDADRVLALDETGNELDGDFIEAICALDLKEQGHLARNTVVTTVMCNLGFTRAMRQQGIEVIQTAVGDSNVLAAMREGGYVIGGEQSGHMIFLEHNSTGDGLVTALQLLVALRRAAMPLSSLAQVMTRYPQVLINVKVSDQVGFAGSKAIAQAVREAEGRLGEQGRVLLRPSGTEPLVRVMVEATEEHIAQDEAELLASVVAQELG
ncbi:MAG: phosphoglucosamine mutase [Coriobacteriales bacterium]|jgi:phosphoglucosamine mutase|nr:phosphoglucosamine mutase [Coriobacteriales bacterium]